MKQNSIRLLFILLALLTTFSCAGKEEPRRVRFNEILYTDSDGAMMKKAVDDHLGHQNDYFKSIGRQVAQNLEGGSITPGQADILELQLEIKRLRQEISLLKGRSRANTRAAGLALSLGQVAIDYDETRLKEAMQAAGDSEKQVRYMYYENLYNEMGK